MFFEALKLMQKIDRMLPVRCDISINLKTGAEPGADPKLVLFIGAKTKGGRYAVTNTFSSAELANGDDNIFIQETCSAFIRGYTETVKGTIEELL